MLLCAKYIAVCHRVIGQICGKNVFRHDLATFYVFIPKDFWHRRWRLINNLFTVEAQNCLNFFYFKFWHDSWIIFIFDSHHRHQFLTFWQILGAQKVFSFHYLQITTIITSKIQLLFPCMISTSNQRHSCSGLTIAWFSNPCTLTSMNNSSILLHRILSPSFGADDLLNLLVNAFHFFAWKCSIQKFSL